MTALKLDGKAVADKIVKQIKEDLNQVVRDGMRPPGLGVVLVGDDVPSHIYVNRKKEACEKAGIKSFCYHLDGDVSQETLLSLIKELNHRPDVDGILVQLPLPAHIDSNLIIDHIDVKKDVDGFHAYNLGRTALRRPLLRSCTPMGVMELLQAYAINLRGLDAVVIGASNHVGRPMGLELLNAGCTTTICHRFTRNLEAKVKTADLVVSAVGKADLIPSSWVKDGAICIDIGIVKRSDGSLVGDFAPHVKEKAAYLTPVPGGVGPMTVASLMVNTKLAYEWALMK